MAISNVSLISELSNQFLYCQICQDYFDSKDRVPRILPCLHSFCGQCLEMLCTLTTVSCPLCRRQAPVTRPFPVDTTRVALLETVQRFKCREGKIDGGGESVAGHSRDGAELQETENCEWHKDKGIEWYCGECQVAICSLCTATTHHKGHKFTVLEEILTKTKREVTSLCEEFKVMKDKFQIQVEVSKNIFSDFNNKYEETQEEIRALFNRVVSAVLERQDKVLKTLAATAKADRLVLEDQVAWAESLMLLAELNSNCEKQIASGGSPSNILHQKQTMTSALEEMEKQSDILLKPSPVYEVNSSGLCALTSALDSLGIVDKSAPVDAIASPPPSPQRLHKTAPVDSTVSPSPPPQWLQLDASRCGPGCSVDFDGRTLTNEPSTGNSSTQRGRRFKYSFTCGTVPMSSSFSYWQVRCVAIPNPRIKEDRWLCEVGVASMAFLEAWNGWLWTTGHGLIVVLKKSDRTLHVRPCCNNRHLPDTDLLLPSPEGPVDLTLGFLLDTRRHHLYVIDVNNTRVMCDGDADLSQPLWPVVCVRSVDRCWADVTLQVQSGLETEMAVGLRNLLPTLRQ